jgi:hypothetical protein
MERAMIASFVKFLVVARTRLPSQARLSAENLHLASG